MRPIYFGILAGILCLSFMFLVMSFVSFFYVSSTAITSRASDQGTVALIIEGDAPTTSPGTSGGGGGGGGGGAPTSPGTRAPTFEVTPEELNLFIVATTTQQSEVVLRNTGSAPITFTITSSGLAGILSLPFSEITLQPWESKSLALTFTVPDSGVYAGRVTFTTAAGRKDVLVLINVRSANALFDVSLTIPESFKHLGLSQTLKSFISLLQVGPASQTDVTATYTIKDFDGTTLITESETFRVFRSKNYVKSFTTELLPAGEYVLGVEITYPDGFASASDHFTISATRINYWIIISIVLGIIALAAVSYSILNYKRARRFTKK